MGWSIRDLGIAAVTTIGVIPSLIIATIIFALAYVGLAMAGLVSAVIWGLIGIGVVWVISWTGYFDSDKISAKKILLILGIIGCFAIFGYITDHVSALAFAAPARMISTNPSTTIQQMSLQGDAIAFIMTPYGFAGLLAALAVAVIAVTVYKFKND